MMLQLGRLHTLHQNRASESVWLDSKSACWLAFVLASACLLAFLRAFSLRFACFALKLCLLHQNLTKKSKKSAALHVQGSSHGTSRREINAMREQKGVRRRAPDRFRKKIPVVLCAHFPHRHPHSPGTFAPPHMPKT